MAKHKLGFLILLVGLAGTTSSPATLRAQSHPCAGRCNFCVDGVCIPRRQTYGYYEPHWRRWPCGPPEVCIPGPPTHPESPFGSEVETPGVEDEADPLPQFPHLRSRDQSMEPLPGVEPELPMTPFGDDGAMFESGADSDPSVGSPDFSTQGTPNLIRPTAFAAETGSLGISNPLRGGNRGAATSSHVTRLPASRPMASMLSPLRTTRPPQLSGTPSTSAPSGRANNPLRR